MDPATKKHFEKTIKGFSYNVLGVILPFILSLIAILILRKYEKIWAFIDDGNLFLFGAGLYTASIYLFGENKNEIKEGIDKFLSNLSFWFLIISSAFYCIIYCLMLLDKSKVANEVFVRTCSILFFLLSTIAMYRSVSIDALKTYQDVNIERENQKGVADILDKL